MDVLIIGLGSIAIKHVNALRELLPSVRLYGLRSGKSNYDLEYITNIYSIDDLNRKPDFAIISNPTYFHSLYIKELAVRGIPMMIEKPALHTLLESEELLSIIKKNNIFTYVACNLRFLTSLQFLRSHLEQTISKINEVSIYCGSYLPEWRPNIDFKAVYSANLKMGGGVHLDLIHEIDYATWLFGQPIKFKGFQSSISTLKIDAPDYAHYLLNYENFNATISLNYFRRDPKRIIEVVMEDETLNVDLIKNIITNSKNKVLFRDTDFKIANTYFVQMKYFLHKLLNKEVPMNTFEDSLYALQIALSNE